jgi:uncharacterized protein YaaR (DUF327 family)
LEDLEAEVEINSAWETIRQNIKIEAQEILDYYELKKHRPWFGEGYSTLLDEREQAELQWLQDQIEINGDIWKIYTMKPRKHLKKYMKEYLKYKINELATNSNNKNNRNSWVLSLQFLI